ncbi:MAG TPA: hypothetical protein PKM55_10570 [Acidobacteriota bacterium]|nr:hypothetical protein [Acidobacteriota bacterium]
MKHALRLLAVLGALLLLAGLAPVLAGDSARGGSGTGLQIVGGLTDHNFLYDSDYNPPERRHTLTRSKSSGTTLAGGTVCLFKDSDPWGYTAWEQVCLANGIPYEIHTSSEFATLDFSQFQVIVVCSVQGDAFYSAYTANEAKFVNYVINGGLLFFSGCTYFSATWDPNPPGTSIVNTRASDSAVLIDDPTHPAVAGIASPFTGNSASHNHFTNLPIGVHVITHGQDTGFPTLIEYSLGSGVVLASGLTLEWGIGNGQGAGQVLINGLLYLYYLEPPFELTFDDDYGRAQLCLNPETGEFLYRVLTGAGAGEYALTGTVYTRGNVLFLQSPRPSPWTLLLSYDMATHRANAYLVYPEKGVRSVLYDRNTLNDGACGN